MSGANNNQRVWDRHCREAPCGERLRAVIAELKEQNKRLARKVETRDARIERLYEHLRLERNKR